MEYSDIPNPFGTEEPPKVNRTQIFVSHLVYINMR
jgi:hypothetical protein